MHKLAGTPGFEPGTRILEILMIAISPRPLLLFFALAVYRVFPTPLTESAPAFDKISLWLYNKGKKGGKKYWKRFY